MKRCVKMKAQRKTASGIYRVNHHGHPTDANTAFSPVENYHKNAGHSQLNKHAAVKMLFVQELITIFEEIH